MSTERDANDGADKKHKEQERQCNHKLKHKHTISVRWEVHMYYISLVTVLRARSTYRPQHASVLCDNAKASQEGEQEHKTSANQHHVDGNRVEVSADDEGQERTIDGHPYSNT